MTEEGKAVGKVGPAEKEQKVVMKVVPSSRKDSRPQNYGRVVFGVNETLTLTLTQMSGWDADPDNCRGGVLTLT